MTKETLTLAELSDGRWVTNSIRRAVILNAEQDIAFGFWFEIIPEPDGGYSLCQKWFQGKYVSVKVIRSVQEIRIAQEMVTKLSGYEVTLVTLADQQAMQEEAESSAALQT